MQGLVAALALITVSWVVVRSVPPVVHLTTAPAPVSPYATVAPSPSTTTPLPAALTVRWSCPAGARGWTATFSWPVWYGQGPSWELQDAVAARGPWRVVGEGTSSQVPSMTGLPAGTSGWVRLGAAASLSMGAPPVVQGHLTVPPGC